ncbi:hypothetical protein RND71_031007 [Anisodus tanguticus]|uniref:Cation/H+ exchanger domain-containing protein n=1 Tax=Anisodus tanguticus TaxID=243964 RepID=A0AAE1RIB7_9SOLA|nr:hypothetical protein RND71_031007 [Anisodus tanguticus]
MRMKAMVQSLLLIVGQQHPHSELIVVFLDWSWLVEIMGLDVVARLGVRILSDDDQVSVDSITLFVALLCGCIVIGHLLEENRWINESITALVIVHNQDETPLLYSLVLGEGVVNDATSVVLFNAIQKHSTDREVALMILMAFLSYVMAEFARALIVIIVPAFQLFALSRILTVFFCRIVMSHYNVTANSKVTTSPGKSVGVSDALLGLVLVGRACFVFPLSRLSNCLKRSEHDKFALKQQVFGLITKPLLRCLLPSSQGFNSLISSEQPFARPLLNNGQEPEAEMGNVDFRRPASLSMLLKKPSGMIFALGVRGLEFDSRFFHGSKARIIQADDERMHGTEVESVSKLRSSGDTRYTQRLDKRKLSPDVSGGQRICLSIWYSARSTTDFEKTNQQKQFSEINGRISPQVDNINACTKPRVEEDWCQVAEITKDEIFEGNVETESLTGYRVDGNKDFLRHSCNTESQIPEQLSEANALDFVDHYLSLYDEDALNEVKAGGANKIVSPLIFSLGGPQRLASRMNVPKCSKKLRSF